MKTSLQHSSCTDDGLTLAETYYHEDITMSQHSYVEDMLATISQIAALNEGSLMRKIEFQKHLNDNTSVQVCNNASFSGHLNGNTVTPAGQVLENHYIGGYHYFTVAD